MKGKIRLFRKALALVWDSAPGWATVNIVISVLQSFLPLVLVFLIKLLIDNITSAASTGAETGSAGIIWMIAAVVVVYFLDETSTDFGNFVRQKQSVKLEAYMYGLLHTAIALEPGSFYFLLRLLLVITFSSQLISHAIKFFTLLDKPWCLSSPSPPRHMP